MLATTAIHLIEKIFFSAPLTILPLLNTGARMDMIDLHHAGQPAVVANSLGGESTLTQIDKQSLTIQLTESSSWELHVHNDSTIEVTHTYIAIDTTKVNRHFDKYWHLLPSKATKPTNSI